MSDMKDEFKKLIGNAKGDDFYLFVQTEFPNKWWSVSLQVLETEDDGDFDWIYLGAAPTKSEAIQTAIENLKLVIDELEGME